MFNISNNNIITISRGDNASCTLTINNGTPCNYIPYELQEGDIVYLSVFEFNSFKRNEFDEFSCGLIRKMFITNDLNENGEIVINFIPSDTESLLPGTYYYKVKIKKENGEINTIINDTKFIIED